MSEKRCFWILELSIFLKENTNLEYYLEEIFLLRVIVRSVYFNCLVVFIDRVKLFDILKSGPTLTKKFFAKRSIQHNKILYSSNNLLEFSIILAYEQLIYYLFKISQLNWLFVNISNNWKSISFYLLIGRINQCMNYLLHWFVANDKMPLRLYHGEWEITTKFFPFCLMNTNHFW